MSMNRWACVAGVALSFVGVSGPTAHAQMDAPGADAASDLPDGFEVLERSIEAHGGYERQKALKSTRFEGEFKMQFPGMGQPMSGAIIVTRAAPNKQRVQIDLPPFGKVDQGTDGEAAWSEQPGMGLRILEGEELEAAVRDADFYEKLEPRKTYSAAETLGVSEIEGQRCYEVRVTSNDGDDSTQHFSIETGLLVKTSGENEAIVFTGYKTVKGIAVASVMKVLVSSPQGEMTQTITFNKIEIDPELPASAFDTPGSF